MVLARPEANERVLWPVIVHHFGPNVTPSYVSQLADKLEAAIDDSNMIGVRDDLVNVHFPLSYLDLEEEDFLAHFRAHFPLRPAETDLPYDGSFRLAQMYRFLTEWKFPPEIQFCSAWIHFGLSKSNALVRMIGSQDRIGLISSKPELAKLLRDLLSVEVDYYQTPEMYHRIASADDKESHDLGVFSDVHGRLRVRHPGQLFLVGAGIWGKVYCHKIQALGGIALDIGAVCDAWVNIPSRPTVYQSMFNEAGHSVPAELLLSSQVGSARADVNRS